MIKNESIPHDKILVTTFTDKAALELKDRIQRKIPGINIETMQVSTIHSFCLKLIYKYRKYTDLPAEVNVLDEQSQLLFIYAHSKELGLDHYSEDDIYGFFSNVQQKLNLVTDDLVDPVCLESWCQENIGACSKEELHLWEDKALFIAAYNRYIQLLPKEGLLDFGLIQRYTLELIQKNPSILAEIRKQYPVVLVDEYQDTNAAQDRILNLIAGNGRHFTVVGDDDQSIYRFRGATVHNILSFKDRFPEAKIIKLEENFRSKIPIVNNSQQVIVHNPVRVPKNLMSVRGIGSDVLLIYKETQSEEAKATVDLLQRLYKAGKISSYRDIAILFRSVRYHGVSYIQALQEAGIPHEVIGDASLFKRREILNLCNLISYFNISDQWGDRLYLSNPLLGLQSQTRTALEKNGKNLITFSTAEELQSIGILDQGDQRKLLDLIAVKCQIQSGTCGSMLDLFYSLMECSNCISSFESQNNTNALINFGLISQIMAGWDKYGEPNNYRSFLKYLNLLKQGGVNPITVPLKDAVQIMPIHQAKGLEFPVVVMGSVINGRLPVCPRTSPLEIPYHLRASGRPEVGDPNLVDERKLFYVAATRARDLLIIGTCDEETRCGSGPSIFLKEMFNENFDAATDFTKAYIDSAESKPPSDVVRARHSFSQLSYFLQCPLRYKFLSVYNFHIPWTYAIGFGDNVHRALEAIHTLCMNGQRAEDFDLRSIVENSWISRMRASPEQESEYKDAAVKQISRYIRDYGKSLSSIIKAETDFSFDLDGQIILGKIDLITHADDNQVELIDFKTSKLTAKDDYAGDGGGDLQLDIYSLGAENALGFKVARTTVHYLGDGKLVSKPWSMERRADSLERLNGILSYIERGEFTPNFKYCPYCNEVRNICPYGSR